MSHCDVPQQKSSNRDTICPTHFRSIGLSIPVTHSRRHHIPHKPSKMQFSARQFLIFALPWLILELATSAPTNTTNLILAVSPVDLVADECPTPPTEFLPYPPPAGYQPGPGCPPASSGTQPSENNPPAGFYGGTGSGSGSTTQTSSTASGLRSNNPFAKVLGGFLPSRNINARSIDR